MPSTRVLLPLLSLFLLPLRPLPAEALACPSFPYTIASRCFQDGFCVYYDIEAQTIDDGVLESDDPAPALTSQLDPVMFEADATQGAADLFGMVQAGGEAGRSVVAGRADGHAAASCCDIPTSGSARAETLSVMRVSDLVFSGPTADVEAILHLVFDASSSQVTTGIENATAISSISALIAGAICNGPELMSFRGERTHSLQDNQSADDLFVVSTHTGVLEDVPLDVEEEILVGPFTVPTGVPLTFELWMQTNASMATGGGDADSVLDFALYAGPRGGGLVFELPAGYSADSAEAGIVASSTAVPEPDALLASLLGSALLAAFGLRRRSPAP